MTLSALILCLAASDAFQRLTPLRPAVAFHGKTRGNGEEEPLDIDAALDEALKDDIVDALAEDINAALGKDEAKTPEEMKVGELTGELDLRGVDYSDCVEADELRAKLKDARLSGRAPKDVLDNFNKATAEAMFDKEKNPMNLSKEELEASKGADGAIPGADERPRGHGHGPEAQVPGDHGRRHGRLRARDAAKAHGGPRIEGDAHDADQAFAKCGHGSARGVTVAGIINNNCDLTAARAPRAAHTRLGHGTARRTRA